MNILLVNHNAKYNHINTSHVDELRLYHNPQTRASDALSSYVRVREWAHVYKRVYLCVWERE